MTEKNDTPKKEYTDQEILDIAYNWGKTPSEILSTIILWAGTDELPDLTSDEFYDVIEDWKNDPDFEPWGDEVREDFPDKISYYEAKVEYTLDYIITGTNELRRLLKYEFPYNRENIFKYFRGTEVFPIILEWMGVINSVFEAEDAMQKEYYRLQGFSGWDKESVAKYFCEQASNYYNPDKILTEEDYEKIFGIYCEYLDFVQASDIKKRLIDISARLTAYKKYFLDPFNPKESEAQLAKWQVLNKSTRNKPTDTEQNILESLGNDTLRGQELLKKAGYDFSSHYRGILSNLVKRGVLEKTGSGYTKSSNTPPKHMGE